ncbi:MAG: hypothetical protein QXK71_01900 [Pyrobaculum sp.]|jgi:hypothetical protein
MRYLVIRAVDPVSCYIKFLEKYILVGISSLINPPKFVAIYDDVLIIGVTKEVVKTARAVVALLDGCRVVKILGTSKRAKAVAASIRKLENYISQTPCKT